MLLKILSVIYEFQYPDSLFDLFNLDLYEIL